VSFAAITICVASRRVFIVVVYFVIMTQSGNFWKHPRRPRFKVEVNRGSGFIRHSSSSNSEAKDEESWRLQAEGGDQ
jgi:hypothetical protein